MNIVSVYKMRIPKRKYAQGGVMFLLEGLSPLTELIIWISYAITIVICALTVAVIVEFSKKE